MSCLYRALAHFVPGVATEQLRGMLCEYLSNDPVLGGSKASEMVPWETGMSLQQYVQRMKNMGQWGGAIEIKAFCDLFRMNVKVHSFPNRRVIDFISENPKGPDPWIEVSWTGNHYEPIVRDRRHRITPSQQHSQRKHHSHQTPKYKHSRSQNLPTLGGTQRRYLQQSQKRSHSKTRKIKHHRRRTAENGRLPMSQTQLPRLSNSRQLNQTLPLQQFTPNGGPWDQTVSPNLRGFNNQQSYSTQGFNGFSSTNYYPFHHF